MRNRIEEDHAKMVECLMKDPCEIQEQMLSLDYDLMHCIFGISGEAGELLDAIKRKIIYRKELDVENVVEELGDLEFYLESLRSNLGITREMTLQANMGKLVKRYADYKYSDQRAQERADKQASVIAATI